MSDLDLFQVPASVQALVMRKEIYRGEDDEGRALLAAAPEVQLALIGDDGGPILRTVNAVVAGDAVAFHGAPAGEKMEGLGRRAVVAASETVASIPSWFLDAERACPATTYYVSVQAHGTLTAVDDPARKAEVLAALMAKYQPEGRHVPLAADHPLYAKAIRGLLVAEVKIEHLDCKAKLGQNRTPSERVRVLEALWRRGAPGDVRALARILDRFPDLPRPAFLAAPPGITLACRLDDDDLDEAAALLEGAYWLPGFERAAIRATLACSTATVGARDEAGRLVAAARTMADGRSAWIYDVIVAPHVRGRGVGEAVMRLLLDHPAVRSVRHVRLGTRDAMEFYRRLGFDDAVKRPRLPWPTTEMIRFQNVPPSPSPA
jgi:nitroimidazol reductase NimA-like FMN-containing flavoprotein (pyridoxamine 5'-phosphate oxidase superfamily)/GNAT superfamily N-acetyltransferase